MVQFPCMTYGHKTEISPYPILKVLQQTTEAFVLHVRRARVEAAIWWSALKPDSHSLSPVQYEWTLD